MTFIPQLIDNVTPGESLKSGATKINTNFEAIEDRFNTILDDIGDYIALEIDPDLLELDYVPDSYTPTIEPGCSAVDQLAAHLKGINDKLASLEARLNAHGI